MKKHFLFSLFIALAFYGKAQINLEAAYHGIINASDAEVQVVRFGLMGDKYVYLDKWNRVVRVYSMSHVLEKNFTVPSIVVSVNYSACYFSDNLFDNDSAIEFMVIDPLVSSAFGDIYVFNEDGSILFDRDSAMFGTIDNAFSTSEFGPITPTSTGTKMMFDQQNNGFEVYSLPGNLPCNDCNGGVYSGLAPVNGTYSNKSSLSNAFPNPTNSSTTVDYKLPPGESIGEIVFYNSVGAEVKRFKVTNQFSFITVSVQDISPGTYYYRLTTASGYSSGQKLVVIK